MNKERLEITIDVLQKVAAQRLPFDMTSWVTPNHGCGTAACALGYAALDPRLQAEGLHLTDSFGRTVASLDDYNRIYVSDVAKTYINIVPSFEDEDNYMAASLFFEISENACAFIFDPAWYPDEYPTAEDAADRIEQVMRNHGQPPDNWKSMVSEDALELIEEDEHYIANEYDEDEEDEDELT